MSFASFRTLSLLTFIFLQGFSIGCSRSIAETEAFATLAVRDNTTIVQLTEAQTVSLPCVSRLTLGHLPRGAMRTVQFWLQNPTKQEIAIGAIETSCECLLLASDSRSIEPGGKVQMRLKVDFSDDPNYSGALLLEGTVTSADKSRRLLVVETEVTVN